MECNQNHDDNNTHTGKKLLASTKECPNCSTQGNSQPMNWEIRRDVVDGHRWRSPSTTCRKSIGIREGTFFQQTRISLQKWLILIYWWVREYAVTDAMEEAEVSKHVTVDVYQWLREVCSTKLTSQNIQLGGPGHIVQIDESLFRHKPKVKKHITLFIQYSFSAFNRNRITEAVQHARRSGSLD